MRGVLGHPERPPILDPAKARELFHFAEANRTADGTLTTQEVDEIFSDFDLDGDNQIQQLEFVRGWIKQGLGDEVGAAFLFSRADTDGDGSISVDPDLQRVFGYFDIDGQRNLRASQ
nr:hypothetical protein BaRGS_011553 [Batillaria attramentaria]